MDEHRLRAPSADGALLSIPPLGEVPALLTANADHLAQWDHDFQGRSASRLRHDIRSQILKAAGRYLNGIGIGIGNGIDTPSADPKTRLIVTGHQPELFHPGVWVKNFAVAKLARETGSLALNLIVDNDIPKSPVLKIPRQRPGSLRVEKVPFDDWAGEIPYEDLKVGDESIFESFAERAKEVLGDAIADPIIDDFWPRAIAAKAHTDRIGPRFAAARRGLEASWGIHNLEVPLSAACESEGFQWFACHLLAHLPRFQQVHNDALARYRALYKIRSSHHPVPALDKQGEWLEAPFWVWRSSRPRRKPLLVRQRGKSLDLRIGGEDETLLELPLGPDRTACCSIEPLMELPFRGIRLRTRALTTTMFARFLLGDLFVHGIGGAKYDELGDEISGKFFGIEPPRYLTTSLTLRLGLASDPSSPALLTKVEHSLRDLVWNPERFLPEVDSVGRTLIDAKTAAQAMSQDHHADRISRFQEIRRCNLALHALVVDQIAPLTAERERLKIAVAVENMARSREYSVVLHSVRRVQDALSTAIPGVFEGL